MFELAIRLLAAGGLTLLAGVLGWSQFDTVWKTSAFICLYGFAAYAIELKGRKNSGTAGIAACFDAIAIAALLAPNDNIHSFGFLTLAPIAYAAARYGSLPSAMAPIAAFTLLGAEQWAHNGLVPGSAAMTQALGVLVVGMLLNHRRIVVTVAKPVLPEQVEPLAGAEPEAYMELRESYRKLKDMYQDLERKSRRDRHSADLRLASSGDAIRFHRRLAAQLKKLSGADGLSLFTVSDLAGNLVVRAVEGSAPDSVRQTTLHLQPGDALSAVRSDTERALASLAHSDDSGTYYRNVVLTHRGRVAGLIAIHGDSPAKVEEPALLLEDLAPLAADMIEENASKRYIEGRLRRAELLYEVASAAAGAATPNSLAARVVNQLSEIWDVEHISISWTEGEDCIPASTYGPNLRPLDAMSFAEGPGYQGWLGVEAPEIVAFDVMDDARCLRAEMSKLRIQSLALAPIGSVERPLGFIAAASQRSGAIDVPLVESLRMVAAELQQAIDRLNGRGRDNSGLMLPTEFHRRVAQEGEGSLVYLEPLRKEEMLSRYGQPALDVALRQFSHRLRARLPMGGALCRRPEGDYIALLPKVADGPARAWANEAAATASLIGIPVDEQGRRIPLAIRAKVARIGVREAENAEISAA